MDILSLAWLGGGGPACSEWVGGSSWHSAVGGDCKSSRKLPVSCDVCCLICTLNVIQYFKALKYLNLHTHIYTLVDSLKKCLYFQKKKTLSLASSPTIFKFFHVILHLIPFKVFSALEGIKDPFLKITFSNNLV